MVNLKEEMKNVDIKKKQKRSIQLNKEEELKKKVKLQVNHQLKEILLMLNIKTKKSHTKLRRRK